MGRQFRLLAWMLALLVITGPTISGQANRFRGLRTGGGGGVSLPGVPSSLASHVLSDYEVALTWERADNTDTAMVIERAPDSAGSPGTYAAMADLDAHANITTDSSAVSATTYWYRAKAKNASGASTYSSAVSATTSAFGGTTTSIGTITATVNSAWQITLTWTNPNSLTTFSPTFMVERSANGGLDYTPTAVVANGTVGATMTAVDTPLSPGTLYYYRVRKTNANIGGYGEWSYANATTTTLGSYPNVPTSLAIATTSATASSIAWTDTNAGAATYQVETAPITGSGFTDTATWTQATETSAGATLYALTTVANTPVFVRVRAKMSALNSAYTVPDIVRPASTSTGGTTYNIGPGKTYTSLGAFNWSSLGPGDTVNIYYATYAEKIAITRRGAAASPIRIVGIPDVSGNKPIIDGLSAVSNSQFTGLAAPNTFGDLSLVLFGRFTADPTGHQPGYISLENLVITRGSEANSPATYTQSDATTRSYIAGVAGIYLSRGDHITIKNNTIDSNGNGIFGAWNWENNGYTRALSDITVSGNTFTGNGTVGSYLEHHSYLEAERTIYEYNHYLPERSGANGGGLKDRGVNTIIRYNWFSGGALRVDLPETQNGFGRFVVAPGYRKTYVYGNVLESVDANDPIPNLMNYGGDQGASWNYRKGILYFAYNTFILRQNTTGHGVIFQMKQGAVAETFDARNNVMLARADTGTTQTTHFLQTDGAVYLGSNWASPSILAVYTTPGNGSVSGMGNLVSAVGNEPGFLSRTTGDYRPAASGQILLGATWALPGSFPASINLEYVQHLQSQARAALTTLGYYQ